MSTSTAAPVDRTDTAPSGAAVAQRVLLGISALAVLLQGLWAGLFIRHETGEYIDGWVKVHSAGGEVAIAAAALATVIGFWKVRARKDLWIGSGVLTVLLILESYLGGLISDHHKEDLVPVHVPLAMALMGVTIWLVVRVRQTSAR